VATVWIPSLLRPLAGGRRQVTAAGGTVGEIIAALDRDFPGMRERLCQGDRLQPGIAIAVDGETATLGLLEPVRPESEVQILPAIAGG
jgi:molybdopterin synthase sulfur carrier subunit